MPRSLSRLRWRAASQPVIFPRINPEKARTEAELDRKYANLEKAVERYVVRQSNPEHLRVQTVVNPKARRQPAGQHVVPPRKPHTLRDLVDPEAKAQHGEIIYVFRHIKSNQIIYSLQELLDKHHLSQLPFIGKHSQPAALRPDEWIPHCVISFPTAQQGHNAFRKLREFRHMHELAWEKTNPEYKTMPIKVRMRKLMDQRANMSADLAEVLRIQEQHGVEVGKAQEEMDQKARDFLDRRWQAIEETANATTTKEKVTDNVKWLEHQIHLHDMKLNMKHNQNEADQKRLLAAREGIATRLRRVQYAVRKTEQLKHIQEDLTKAAAPANEAGAEARLKELRSQAAVLQEALQSRDPTRTREDIATDRDLLVQHQEEIKTLEQAFDAKEKLDNRDHHIARSVLPKALRKTPSLAYTLEGVSIRWADLQDAYYGRGKWPEVIEHESLPLNAAREDLALLSAEEFDIEKSIEVGKIIEELQKTQAISGKESLTAAA
ncbi:hypothetical protein ACN47E_004396 [Coniothyrium glycines]